MKLIQYEIIILILQVFCIVLVSFGLGVEFAKGAHSGFLTITSGCFIFGIMGKIEGSYHKKRRFHK